MRSGFTLLLIVTLVFAGGYFYLFAQQLCPVPLAYQVGVVDERFDITKDEVIAVTEKATSLWEEAAGRDLFVYEEGSDFYVNFIFDERQALADAEKDFKERLDSAADANSSISNTYQDLVDQYENLKVSYEAQVKAYETELSNYNAKVAEYNSAGGAPQKEYNVLQREKAELDREQTELNSLVSHLNDMVDEINRIGRQGNQLVETYNRGVNTYNEKFGEPREFTQGDYQGDHINIYTYDNLEELELVLVHEFGHALHLGHVEGEESLMYYLIGSQPDPIELSQSDLAEFEAVCSEDFSSVWTQIKNSFRSYY